MIDPRRSAAVITAAGLSSRMGQPKALLDWNGLPLAQHQLDGLAGWGEVVLVLGHEAARIAAALRLPANARAIVHAGYRAGRASSLRAGFAALRGPVESILVVGVDQPLAPAGLAALVATATPADAIAMPTWKGRRGHPVLFAGRLIDELLAIREEDEGLRAVVRRHPARLVPVDGPFWDLNLPEDHAAALEAMRLAADAGHRPMNR